MPFLQRGVATATKRMPKVISPRGHAIADYAIAGLCLLMAVRFWKRNRRAAVASLALGVVEAGTALVTDYPGGIVPVIDFSTHGTIDIAMAATTFALPGLMSFDEEPEARFFRMMGLGATVVGGLTNFHGSGRGRRRKWAA